MLSGLASSHGASNALVARPFVAASVGEHEVKHAVRVSYERAIAFRIPPVLGSCGWKERVLLCNGFEQVWESMKSSMPCGLVMNVPLLSASRGPCILTQHGWFQLVSLCPALPSCCIDIWICKFWAHPSLAVCGFRVSYYTHGCCAGAVFSNRAHYVVGARFFARSFDALAGRRLVAASEGEHE